MIFINLKVLHFFFKYLTESASASNDNPPDLSQDKHLSKLIEEIIRKAELEHEESIRQETNNSPPHLTPISNTPIRNVNSQQSTPTLSPIFPGNNSIPNKIVTTTTQSLQLPPPLTLPKTGKPAAFELLQMKQKKQQQQQQPALLTTQLKQPSPSQQTQRCVYQIEQRPLMTVKPVEVNILNRNSPVCYENAFLTFIKSSKETALQQQQRQIRPQKQIKVQKVVQIQQQQQQRQKVNVFMKQDVVTLDNNQKQLITLQQQPQQQQQQVIMQQQPQQQQQPPVYQLLMPATNNLVVQQQQQQQQPTTSRNQQYKPNMVWANFNYYQVNNCETSYSNQNKFYPMTMEPIQQTTKPNNLQNQIENTIIKSLNETTPYQSKSKSSPIADTLSEADEKFLQDLCEPNDFGLLDLSKSLSNCDEKLTLCAAEATDDFLNSTESLSNLTNHEETTNDSKEKESLNRLYKPKNESIPDRLVKLLNRVDAPYNPKLQNGLHEIFNSSKATEAPPSTNETFQTSLHVPESITSNSEKFLMPSATTIATKIVEEKSCDSQLEDECLCNENESEIGEKQQQDGTLHKISEETRKGILKKLLSGNFSKKNKNVVWAENPDDNLPLEMRLKKIHHQSKTESKIQYPMHGKRKIIKPRKYQSIDNSTRDIKFATKQPKVIVTDILNHIHDKVKKRLLRHKTCLISSIVGDEPTKRRTTTTTTPNGKKGIGFRGRPSKTPKEVICKQKIIIFCKRFIFFRIFTFVKVNMCLQNVRMALFIRRSF